MKNLVTVGKWLQFAVVATVALAPAAFAAPEVSAAPEPTTLSLVAVGVVGALLIGRRTKR